MSHRFLVKHSSPGFDGDLSFNLRLGNPKEDPIMLWLTRGPGCYVLSGLVYQIVIKNGNKVLKRTVGETEQEYEPTTAEEKQDRRNEMKARGTLLMALPNKDQLKFHSYKDAKLLMEAIEKRYGGNKESKKKTHALIWMNKEEIKTISLDDLYNNLKIYELELAGSSSTSQNPQNVAFLSSSSTNSNCNSSTNEADNTAHGVSATHTQCNSTSGDNLSNAMICAFLASQPNSPQLVREDLEQIDPDDLEEMDLQWEMAILTIRARIFIQRTGRKLDVNGQRVGFDRTKVECYNCHKYDHFARECRVPRNQENRGRENNKRIVTVETPIEIALVAQDGLGGYDWSYQAEEEHPTNFALMAHTSSGSSSSSDSESLTSLKLDSGYNETSSNAASPAVRKLCEFIEMLKSENMAQKQLVKDTTARDRAVVSENKGKGVNDVKASACWGNPQQKEYKELGVIGSGCSRYMTGKQMLFLLKYMKKDYDGGFVSFKMVKVLEFLDRQLMEKADEGFFVVSTLKGPNWLFDVDSLTISMNYVLVVAGKQTNDIAGTRDYVVTGQAEKKTEHEQGFTLIPFCTTDQLISQDKDREDDQATRSEFDRLLQQEKQTVHPNNTNSINTVSTHVSAARPSFTNDDLSSPVNAVEAFNAFEEHLFERFSPFKNAFTLPPVSNVTLMDVTGIFSNAYDDEDVGAEADLNNFRYTP
ncbi:ribonuclease H-like domain-containing protein [Tanacetum coccineum]